MCRILKRDVKIEANIQKDDLFVDIYDLLVDDTKIYLNGYGLLDDEADILSVFVVQKFGNHEDLEKYLLYKSIPNGVKCVKPPTRCFP